MSFQLAIMKSGSPKIHNTKLAEPDQQNILKANKYEPRDAISTDQYVIKTPGWLEHDYGRENANNSYHGGTIYVDAAFGLIRAMN